MNNIFDISNLHAKKQEIFESLHSSPDIRIERIITLEPYSKPGEWYDQDTDEWVVLIQGLATLEFANKKYIELKAGDHIFIPAHKIHRIKQSSKDEKCIWLAVHGKMK